MNRRRITDIIAASIIVILFFISFELIKENKGLKRELSEEYYQLIQETYYALSFMEHINWDETMNNEHVQQVFYEHQNHLDEVAFTFMMLENDLKKLGNILSDITFNQRMIFYQEEISEEKIQANKERIRTLTFLFQDMADFDDGNTNWYDVLHEEDSPLIPLMETRLKYIE